MENDVSVLITEIKVERREFPEMADVDSSLDDFLRVEILYHVSHSSRMKAKSGK